MTKKIALVTGGSRGLGKNIALHLAKKGVGVVLTYLNSAEEAHQVVTQIQQLGEQAATIRLDTGDTKSFDLFAEQFKETLESTWGRSDFDYLVNNAGFGHMSAVAETTEDDFDALMNVHFKGVFFLTQTLLPMVVDGGSIVNMSSGLARFSLAGYGAYAAMKGGVEVLTRYLAQELGPRQISVNTIAPGAIETDFGGGAVRDNPEINGYIASVTALGRAGLPDDVGGAVASLLTGDNRWVTGQRIEVSGGMNL